MKSKLHWTMFASSGQRQYGGEQCSIFVPFALVRPAPPSVPSGQRLAQ
jgi:hypothetical protein